MKAKDCRSRNRRPATKGLLAAVIAVLLLACGAIYRPPVRAADEPPPKMIPWERAVKLIESGQVQEVTQLHSREVTLKTNRGEIFQTLEPALDEVIRVVRERAPNKDSIPIATE
jgi:hypothetical protein